MKFLSQSCLNMDGGDSQHLSSYFTEIKESLHEYMWKYSYDIFIAAKSNKQKSMFDLDCNYIFLGQKMCVLMFINKILNDFVFC